MLNQETVEDTTQETVAPASRAQQRLWLMEKVDSSSSAYNIRFGWRLLGRVDRAALGAAVTDLVSRHEVLRTTFEHDGDELLQVIAPPAPVPVSDVDLSDRPDREAALDALAEAQLRIPFDLERGPLLRAHLVRVADQEHVLFVVLDHLVCDAWSLRLMHTELVERYAAHAAPGIAAPLDEPDIQYADFAVWQRDQLAGGGLDRQLDHWRRHLADLPARLELPTCRPRGRAPRGRGGSDEIELPADLVADAERLAAETGSSLFTVLLTAFSVLLARYCGQPDHVVGSLVANRTRAETEGVIGFFTNTVALRMDVGGEPTFREVLARVRETVLDAYAHQEVPFDRVVEELQPRRESDRQPFFDVMMQFADIDRECVELADVRVEPLRMASEPAPVDLILAVLKEEGRLVGVWDFDVRLFDLGAVRRMQRHYLTLLRAMVAHPDTPVAAVRLVDPDERLQLLGWGRGTALPVDGWAEAVHDPVVDIARRAPDAIAVASAEPLTYADLDDKANRLAHHLRSLGVRRETLVGVALTGADRVVAELAVLRARGVVVDLSSPVDGAAPPRCRVVVTEAGATRPAGHGPAVVHVDQDAATIAAWPADPPGVPPVPEANAYLLAEPRWGGHMMLSYRALAGLIAFQRAEFGIGRDVVVPLRGRTGSAAALFESTLALCAGARLAVCDGPVTGAALVVVDADETDRVPDLPADAEVVVLGDVDALPLARGLGKRLDRCVRGVYDVPAGVWCALHAPADEPPGGTLGVGVPAASGTVYVLDEWLHLVPAGVRGELCFGGPSIARGVPGSPAGTAARYLPDPFGGPASRLYRTGVPARWSRSGVLELLETTAPGPVEAEAPAETRTAPAGPVEQIIGEVWCDVLHLDDVVLEDDFFDLGGHSLLASQVRTRLDREFGLDVPVRVLFENPLLSDFAAAVLEIADSAGREDQ
ncbi:Non-ribosomal peptide synthetase component F [Lentzea xinjiangensis]|uniref:Non-ribosomal peptide synthetase component F n=1 Tax=Lentzea xinjiangensis TaxID=402600 RepID=A0A1H9WMU5_9PSEU|nr:condensation domain-containing protein [Lentzea xinjiangensis]SES35089.1 Non-ribosomal peptide synthetase component F [Lentzea xinjiangensis]